MTLRLRIGGDRDILNPAGSTALKFLPTDTAYESVFSFLVAVVGFASLVEVYTSKPDEGAKPWADENYATFDGLLCNVTLRWKPRPVVYSAIMYSPPTEICFEKFEVAPLPLGETVNLGLLEHFIFGLSQMMIVSYVENHKHHLNAKYGSIASWPMVWQFARIVRNAMSHGNKLNITDGKSAMWKGLTYSDTGNGRAVVNADLFPGDLIVLLRELEDAL